MVSTSHVQVEGISRWKQVFLRNHMDTYEEQVHTHLIHTDRNTDEEEEAAGLLDTYYALQDTKQGCSSASQTWDWWLH